MTPRLLPAALLALLLAGAALPPAAADGARPLSRAEAARLARERVGGGRILDIRRDDGGYAVKVLRRGQVQVVRIPGPRRRGR